MELSMVLVVDGDNPVAGDLRLVGGTFEFTTALGREVAQRLTVRFRFWRGEWFANLDAGVPYVTDVFEKGVSDAALRNLFTQVIVTTKGVAAVDSLTLSRDSVNRQLDPTFVARLQDGTAFRSTSYGPFVVAV